jgi:membrane protein required for colicin V production
MNFTLLDLIILAILALSSILGAYKGAIKLIIGIVTFLLSIIATYLLYPLANNIFIDHIDNKIILTIASAIASYLISVIMFSLLSTKCCALVKPISCGVMDRFIGLLLGFIRGVIFCLILFSLTAIFFSESYIDAKTSDDIIKNTVMDKYPEWLKQSLTTKYLDRISRDLVKLISKDEFQYIELPHYDKK